MEEIWKDIKGYEGKYQVSNLGRVKRLRHKVNSNNGGRYTSEMYIKSTDNGNGYKIVGLSKNHKRKNYYVHRLVAEAFIENLNNYKEVNHKDNNKDNNQINNLEWCDRSYNMKHSYKNGFHIAPKSMLGKKGKNHPISKPVKQYDLNGNFIKEYESANLASQATKVCYMSIKKCRCGRQKTAGGFIWTY